MNKKAENFMKKWLAIREKIGYTHSKEWGKVEDYTLKVVYKPTDLPQNRSEQRRWQE